jgi:hypothetical protein
VNDPFVILGIVLGVPILLGVILLVVAQSTRRRTTHQNPSAEDSKKKLVKGMAVGISLGMGTEVALGIAFKNIAQEIGLGCCVGIANGPAGHRTNIFTQLRLSIHQNQTTNPVSARFGRKRLGPRMIEVREEPLHASFPTLGTGIAAYGSRPSFLAQTMPDIDPNRDEQQ